MNFTDISVEPDGLIQAGFSSDFQHSFQEGKKIIILNLYNLLITTNIYFKHTVKSQILKINFITDMLTNVFP